MGLIPAARYAELRARERSGERDVFFPAKPAPVGNPAQKGGFAAPDPIDALEACPVLPPRVRRRA